MNPPRAGVVANLHALDSFPKAGHPAILEMLPRPWQPTGMILERFGRNLAPVRTAVRTLVEATPKEAEQPRRLAPPHPIPFDSLIDRIGCDLKPEAANDGAVAGARLGDVLDSV